jgi:hypothetical protein
MAAEYLKMGWVAPLQPPSSSTLILMYHELITSRPSGHAEATALTRCAPFKGVTQWRGQDAGRGCGSKSPPPNSDP